MRRQLSIPGFVGKLILTIAAVIGLFAVVQLVWVRSVVSGSARAFSRPAGPSLESNGLKRDVPAVARPWPLFPGGKPSGLSRITINGTPVVSETLELTASAAEVLDYYRAQMRARGWKDSTEETFDLEPEVRHMVGDERSLQSDEYARIYQETVESQLVLTRGDRTMQVSVGPAAARWRRTVRISMVGTGSLREFSNRLAGSLIVPGARGEESVMTATEEVAGSTLNTAIRSSGMRPGAFYLTMMKELQVDGWEPVFTVPAEGSRSEMFALLTKDGDYAYLIVGPSPSGSGASAVLTKASDQSP